MAARTLICFPIGEAPGLRAEAAQLALGLSARGDEVLALGPLGSWRHALRLAGISATEFSVPLDERKLTRAIQEEEPQVIHAFGAEMAQHVLPLTVLVGAGGVATLGHEDLVRLNPASFRTASTVFVPCEHLREQVGRRLPSVPVVTTEYLLPPPAETPASKLRFLADELGLLDGAPMVLMADYFRGSEVEVALALIAATPIIAQRVPGVQVVIAGKGVRLPELEQQAFEVNDRLGYRAVLLPGHRDDLQQMLTLATVAVGSGRFALEAVGAGRALVAVGASGMVGAFTDETAKVARFTCCGRHGHLEPVVPGTLAAEIAGLFSYPDYRERFAREGQQLVLADCERSCRAAQIAAYYGRSAPAGSALHTVRRMVTILPDDLRELLFTLPTLAGIRAHYPQTKSVLVAAPAHRRLLEQCEWAGEVLVKPTSLAEWPAFLRGLCRPRADLCLSLVTGNTAMLYAGCSLAPHRLGFAEGVACMLLSDHLHMRTPACPTRALTLAHALGVANGAPAAPPILPTEVREATNRGLLAAGLDYGEPMLLLCPRAEAGRAWPSGHWLNLLRLLVAERPERIVVLDAERLILPSGVVSAPIPSDSLALAALLARASAVIAPDSGVLHLADLLGVITLGLYGPTSPETCSLPNERRQPLCHREFPCHPCADAPCGERHCLRALTPAEVSLALSECLDLPMLAAV